MWPTIIRRLEAEILALRLEVRQLKDRYARRRAFSAKGTGGSGTAPQAKFIKYVE